MFVYLTIKWAGRVSKLKKQKKVVHCFPLFLRNAQFLNVKRSLVTVHMPDFRFSSPFCYKSLLEMANPSTKDWYTFKASLNFVDWEEPVGNLPRKHPL